MYSPAWRTGSRSGSLVEVIGVGTQTKTASAVSIRACAGKETRRPLVSASCRRASETSSIGDVPAHSSCTRELCAGTSPIDDVSDARLHDALTSGLRVSLPAQARIDTADAVFVCVPTPITSTKDPDLEPVLQAGEYIRQHLRRGQIVILQSTTFPGTTTGPFRDVLEQSGLVAGTDFDLAFAPERVNPGDPASASKAVPRLVGATNATATQRAATLLGN